MGLWIARARSLDKKDPRDGSGCSRTRWAPRRCRPTSSPSIWTSGTRLGRELEDPIRESEGLALLSASPRRRGVGAGRSLQFPLLHREFVCPLAPCNPGAVGFFSFFQYPWLRQPKARGNRFFRGKSLFEKGGLRGGCWVGKPPIEGKRT